MNAGPAAAAALALALLAGAAAAQDAPAAPPAPAAPEAAPDSSPIPWEKDYAAAKEKAAKEGKGVLVYLTPDWFT